MVYNSTEYTADTLLGAQQTFSKKQKHSYRDGNSHNFSCV